MPNHEKIRRCPHCAQLAHFEIRAPQQRCWNCCVSSDFSHIQTSVEALSFRLDVLAGRLIPNCARWAKSGPAALLCAVPAATLMLALCNSFHITIVTAPLLKWFAP